MCTWEVSQREREREREKEMKLTYNRGFSVKNVVTKNTCDWLLALHACSLIAIMCPGSVSQKSESQWTHSWPFFPWTRFFLSRAELPNFSDLLRVPDRRKVLTRTTAMQCLSHTEIYNNCVWLVEEPVYDRGRLHPKWVTSYNISSNTVCY